MQKPATPLTRTLLTLTDRNSNTGGRPELQLAGVIFDSMAANVKHLGKIDLRFSWSPGRFPCMDARRLLLAWVAALAGQIEPDPDARTGQVPNDKMTNPESCLKNVD
jgi:hypothetical protein